MGSIYKVIINRLTHISFIYGLAEGDLFKIPLRHELNKKSQQL
nr:MAG TPA: hypothetical protein [Caudoviricetes sp.]